MGEGLGGGYGVYVGLTPACAREFGEFTAAHLGELLQLHLTEGLVVTVGIQAVITSGDVAFPAVATEAEVLERVAELEAAVAGAELGPCFLPVE